MPFWEKFASVLMTLFIIILCGIFAVFVWTIAPEVVTFLLAACGLSLVIAGIWHLLEYCKDQGVVKAIMEVFVKLLRKK